MDGDERTTAAIVDGLSLPARLRLLWALLRDDRVSPWLKRLGPLGALLYVLSPIDIVPDFLLGPGQIDDLGVIAVMLFVLSKLIVRFAPPGVVAEHLNSMGVRSPGRRHVAQSGPVIDAAFRERPDRS
ncbi:MAG: DUF1232 domain-containing protein [Chloroflexota bacterium]|nr:DUF1232 domain-containing protein [Chloroflexota bacterium]